MNRKTQSAEKQSSRAIHVHFTGEGDPERITAWLKWLINSATVAKAAERTKAA